MKYCAALCSLLSIVSLFGAETPGKHITIFNENLDEVSVNMDYYRAGKSIGGDYGSNDLKCQEEKTFDVGGSSGTNVDHVVLQLYIRASVPREINLNVTERGQLQYGDTVTIKDDEKHIRVSNQTETAVLVLRKADKAVKIGSDPDNFPHSSNVPAQILHVRNKDLAQVMVYYAALCKPSLRMENYYKYTTNTPFPIYGTDATRLLYKDDTLLEQITLCLHEGTEKPIKTISTEENPNVVGTLIQLLIPQSAQKVKVRINDGDIQSGDTLEISMSEEDNKIMILNLRTKEVLARLYSNNDQKSRLILG